MKLLLTLLGLVALCYLAFGALLWFMQERMVFLPGVPGRALTATPADAGLAYEEVRLETGDGVRLHGWFVPAAARRGTVLFFHGNAGNISHRLESIAQFHGLGLDTFIIDYRGYGRSEGSPGEAGLYRDAAAAWRHLVQERAIAPEQIVILGRSLGGAVAADLAARERPAALVVESAFTSARDMARRLYRFYPVGLMLRLRLPVREYLAEATCPVLVVHAREDEIIPFAMGEALYAAAPEPKSFLALRGDHNTAFLTDRARYLAGLGAFLDARLPGPVAAQSPLSEESPARGSPGDPAGDHAGEGR